VQRYGNTRDEEIVGDEEIEIERDTKAYGVTAVGGHALAHVLIQVPLWDFSTAERIGAAKRPSLALCLEMRGEPAKGDACATRERTRLR
jgi:hypothetical protein